MQISFSPEVLQLSKNMAENSDYELTEADRELFTNLGSAIRHLASYTKIGIRVESEKAHVLAQDDGEEKSYTSQCEAILGFFELKCGAMETDEGAVSCIWVDAPMRMIQDDEGDTEVNCRVRFPLGDETQLFVDDFPQIQNAWAAEQLLKDLS